MKKLHMEIMNSEKLSHTQGGGVGDILFRECYGKKDFIIKWCMTFEANCPIKVWGCEKEGFTCQGGVIYKDITTL